MELTLANLAEIEKLFSVENQVHYFCVHPQTAYLIRVMMAKQNYRFMRHSERYERRYGKQPKAFQVLGE